MCAYRVKASRASYKHCDMLYLLVMHVYTCRYVYIHGVHAFSVYMHVYTCSSSV